MEGRSSQREESKRAPRIKANSLGLLPSLTEDSSAGKVRVCSPTWIPTSLPAPPTLRAARVQASFPSSLSCLAGSTKHQLAQKRRKSSR